jgi:hypothetical protein
MNKQGILGVRLSHAHKLVLLAATALIALAAPAAASAVTTVEGEDHGDHVHIYVDGDGAAQTLTATATSSTVTFTGGTLDSTDDDFDTDYCTGTGPVICTFPSASHVIISADLAGGADSFDGSGATTSDFIEFYGGSGADTFTGGPGSDSLHLDDGEADNASSCGGGNDVVRLDAGLDTATGCEYTGLELVSLPTIAGTPRVGSQLAASGFSLSGGPATDQYYYWYTCATPTQDGCGDLLSTDPTYTPQAADQGRYLFVDREAAIISGGFYLDDIYTSSAPVLVGAAVTPSPSNAFTPGKFSGTSLSVTTPGPGVLTSGPASTAGASKAKGFATKKKKKKKALVGKGKVTATGAGTFKLPVKLTSAGKKLLKKKHKLKVKVKVTFTPTGGIAASKTVSVTFKKKK